MSAEVFGSARVPSHAPQASSPAPLLALLEPSLVNRLVAVCVAIFAAPALLALRTGAGAPTTEALGWTLLAASLCAGGFGALLHRAPPFAALRPARALSLALLLEALVLALGFAFRLAS